MGLGFVLGLRLGLGLANPRVVLAAEGGDQRFVFEGALGRVRARVRARARARVRVRVRVR